VGDDRPQVLTIAGADVVLLDDDGVATARVELVPGATATSVAAQAVQHLAGRRLETADQALADALVARGLRLQRAATDLRHDVADLPPPQPLPAGWSLAGPGFDDDVLAAVTAAYGPDHPDGGWTTSDTQEVRAMFAGTAEVPPLAYASARLLGPDGRSAGHVLVAGPVPWRDTPCGWVLNVAVAPAGQGRGLGRALMVHALHGVLAAGLPALELSIVDGGPARPLYDRLGFRVLRRVLTVDLPAAPTRR
jgi:GNAT superfamily N-acetyltransferase